MCGGSANSRCLPPTVYGDRTNPAASRPPRAIVAARALSVGSPVGRLEADAVRGAAGDDQDGAGLRGACGRGSRRCRRARPGACRGRSRAPSGPRGRRATAPVPTRGRNVEVGVLAGQRGQLAVGEVGDPDRAPGVDGPAATTSFISRSHLGEVGGRRPAAGGSATPSSRAPPRARRAAAAASRRPWAVKPWRSIEVIRSSTTRALRLRPCRAARSRSSSRPTVWITRPAISSGTGV